MIKLSMVSSVDRHNTLVLEKEDFNRAMGWLLSAETRMDKVFGSGQGKGDNAVIEEVLHFLKTMGQASEAQIVQFCRKRVAYASQIPKIIEVMEAGGDIVCKGNDRMGLKIFSLP